MQPRRWLCWSCLFGMLASGLLLISLRAEDRLSPESFLRVPPFGQAAWEGTRCANPDERIPDELVTELTKVFQELAPETAVKLEGKELKAQFECQKYVYPKRAKSGIVPGRTETRIGPSGRGFLLKLQYGELPYSGQAGPAGSFNPNAKNGAELPDHDWNQRRYEFTLPNNRGYLRLYYSYGNQTDTKLLSGIVAAIDKVYGFEDGDCCVFGTKPQPSPESRRNTN